MCLTYSLISLPWSTRSFSLKPWSFLWRSVRGSDQNKQTDASNFNGVLLYSCRRRLILFVISILLVVAVKNSVSTTICSFLSFTLFFIFYEKINEMTWQLWALWLVDFPILRGHPLHGLYLPFSEASSSHHKKFKNSLSTEEEDIVPAIGSS